MRKFAGSIFAALIAVLALAGLASAHIKVSPGQSTTGAYEKYTARVPNEKDVPTIKVEMKFPDIITVNSFEPVPGWTYEVQKDASGKVTGVIWSGGKIGPGEFQEFSFIGANPKQPGRLVWKAYQTYQDGSVVAWDGPEGSEHPASVTTLVASGSSAGTDASVEQPGQSAATTAAQTASSSTATWIGVGALVIAVIALGLSGLSLRRR